MKIVILHSIATYTLFVMMGDFMQLTGLGINFIWKTKEYVKFKIPVATWDEESELNGSYAIIKILSYLSLVEGIVSKWKPICWWFQGELKLINLLKFA